ncbi:unnamed protein product [Phaeothamnion confervicola]
MRLRGRFRRRVLGERSHRCSRRKSKAAPLSYCGPPASPLPRFAAENWEDGGPLQFRMHRLPLAPSILRVIGAGPFGASAEDEADASATGGTAGVAASPVANGGGSEAAAGGSAGTDTAPAVVSILALTSTGRLFAFAAPTSADACAACELEAGRGGVGVRGGSSSSGGGRLIRVDAERRIKALLARLWEVGSRRQRLVAEATALDARALGLRHAAEAMPSLRAAAAAGVDGGGSSRSGGGGSNSGVGSVCGISARVSSTEYGGGGRGSGGVLFGLSVTFRAALRVPSSMAACFTARGRWTISLHVVLAGDGVAGCGGGGGGGDSGDSGGGAAWTASAAVPPLALSDGKHWGVEMTIDLPSLSPVSASCFLEYRLQAEERCGSGSPDGIGGGGGASSSDDGCLKRAGSSTHGNRHGRETGTTTEDLSGVSVSLCRRRFDLFDFAAPVDGAFPASMAAVRGAAAAAAAAGEGLGLAGGPAAVVRWLFGEGSQQEKDEGLAAAAAAAAAAATAAAAGGAAPARGGGRPPLMRASGASFVLQAVLPAAMGQGALLRRLLADNREEVGATASWSRGDRDAAMRFGDRVVLVRIRPASSQAAISGFGGLGGSSSGGGSGGSGGGGTSDEMVDLHVSCSHAEAAPLVREALLHRLTILCHSTAAADLAAGAAMAAAASLVRNLHVSIEAIASAAREAQSIVDATDALAAVASAVDNPSSASMHLPSSSMRLPQLPQLAMAASKDVARLAATMRDEYASVRERGQRDGGNIFS